MVLSMDRWFGKVAVVTGASSGIGAGITKQLVEHGLQVVGLARRKVNMETLANNLSGKKGKLYPIQTDLRKEEDILNAFKWIKENLGPIHILVNNAGVIKQTTLVDGDTEVWNDTLDVNVFALCVATREAVRNMRANNVEGHIIHINSISAHRIHNLPFLNVYPASKFAIKALAETLRLELLNVKSKIKITRTSKVCLLQQPSDVKLSNSATLPDLFSNLSPGLTDTEVVPDFVRAVLTKSEEKQMLDAADVVDAVLYALSTPPHVQIQQLILTALDEPVLN